MFKYVSKIIGLLILIIPMGAFALSSDRNQPYHFSADQMVYFSKTNKSIFTGDVHITQGTTQIDGDRVVIVQSPQTHNIANVNVYGHPAHYSTLPDNKKTKLYARASHIYYNATAGITELIGKAHVKQANNTISGPEIWYDMKSGIIKTKALNKQQKTVIVIQPNTLNKLTS